MFKDYGFDDKDFQDEEGKILSFDRFYEDKNGKTNVDIANVELFLENLGVEEYYSDEREEENSEDSYEKNLIWTLTITTIVIQIHTITPNIELTEVANS